MPPYTSHVHEYAPHCTQGRAEDEDLSERVVWKGCLADLKAAGAVLETAVTTVAAAAEQTAVRQLSHSFALACCNAVDGLLGALHKQKS